MKNQPTHPNSPPNPTTAADWAYDFQCDLSLDKMDARQALNRSLVERLQDVGPGGW